jgi:hypothetical protein
VSADGGPQKAAWHLPPRQRPPIPKQGQLQGVEVWPAKAIAFAIAVMYCARAPLLIACVGQPSHVRSGHEDTHAAFPDLLSDDVVAYRSPDHVPIRHGRILRSDSICIGAEV